MKYKRDVCNMTSINVVFGVLTNINIKYNITIHLDVKRILTKTMGD